MLTTAVKLNTAGQDHGVLCRRWLLASNLVFFTIRNRSALNGVFLDDAFPGFHTFPIAFQIPIVYDACTT